MTVRFTKAGTYTFFCDLHLGMKGTVRVVSQRHRIPSVAAHAKTVKTQAARDLTLAKSLANKQAAPGTVDLGEAGKHGVEYFGMVPATTTVPVGSTLSFRITSASYEVHTATFGPGDPAKDPSSYLGQLSASLEAFKPLDAALYPSDPPPAGPATLTPALHGNGFWNSSPLDPVAATPPPQTSAVRFGAPGTYQFYCLIHPYMHGTVVVQ
jgi:plastocyanin